MVTNTIIDPMIITNQIGKIDSNSGEKSDQVGRSDISSNTNENEQTDTVEEITDKSDIQTENE